MCAVVCSLFRIDYEIRDDSQSERLMRRHYSGKRPMTITHGILNRCATMRIFS
jgi:hypothetical protein